MAVKQTAGRDALGEFAPKFAELNDDVLFGQVWSREDKLSLRDRSVFRQMPTLETLYRAFPLSWVVTIFLVAGCFAVVGGIRKIKCRFRSGIFCMCAQRAHVSKGESP